jgi:hypothetical protein
VLGYLGYGANHRPTRLEIDDEGRNDQQSADDAKPEHAIDEVWVGTEKHPSDDRHESGLAPPIDDVSKAERAGNDADQKTGHDSRLFAAMNLASFSSSCSLTHMEVTRRMILPQF